MSHATRHHAINAVERLASVSYLRTGLAGVDAELPTGASEIEFKFNPYHDPRNGQFTFAPGGGVDRGVRNRAIAVRPHGRNARRTQLQIITEVSRRRASTR